MWPFKEPKLDTVIEDYVNQSVEDLQELQSFRNIGETFIYCGIKMLVEDFKFPKSLEPPSMLAAYRTENNELKYKSFYKKNLISLKLQNPQEK